MSLKNKCTLYKVCIRPVMTYTAQVFAHADSKALYQLQILQNNFCRRTSCAPWHVRNDIHIRDLELPTISKYMQDMSKKFFDTAANHPNPLLQSAVSYKTPPYYDLKWSSNRCAPCPPGTPLGDSAREKSPRDFQYQDAHLVASIGQSRADSIPCRSAAIDEVLKAPIYWGYGQQPTNMLLRSCFCL
ncbi:RNA-directed DNA polymerase from mobile element jockey [Eumeta japonica]|uniref:RNA-directed DNA polymerase from mobile element jockey n=1 Tax=Eumeta variegata TaxID=151549 RepID=A0A4C1ZRI1_EUMVA|nr:RNA-directed DNA polymerase from mobile element jockey [Eumeta japonica]